MNDPVAFSIIIPFKSWSPALDECLVHIGNLSRKNYEVFLLPDDPLSLPEAYSGLPLEVIPTGEVNPAVKRDLGANEAQGEFLAFIDDDAYPRPDWLDVAYNYFCEHRDVGAVGGPAVTPKNDSYWARVSGAVFLSPASGGNPERYVPRPPSRKVDDWPSVNLIVRKQTFLQAGGFDSRYWPGEDTVFCMKLVERTKTDIAYVPELIVWHHRRSGLSRHLRQVGNYGLHRGFFAKKFPKTSRKLKYFIPSLWVGFLVVGLLFSLASRWACFLYLAGWMVYLTALGVSWKDIRRHEPLNVALGAVPYIFLTHIWYGTRFVMGLASRELRSSLGR